MKYLTKPIGVLIVIYGCIMSYQFLSAYMHLTQTEMLFLHWDKILKNIAVLAIGAILFEIE